MVNKVQKRKYIIGLFLLLAMATVSTYAWSVDETLNTDPTTVYVTKSPGTTTEVSDYSSRPLGKNKILIEFSTDVEADIEFQFLDTSGNIIICDQDVELNDVDIEDDTEGSYIEDALAAGDHTIVVKGTGVWKDLDSVTEGAQTFNGLMIVIK